MVEEAPMAEESSNPNSTDQSEKTTEAMIESNGPECSESSVKIPEISGVSSGSDDREKSLEFADELMNKGNIAFKEGDFPEASELFSRALEIRVAHYGELAPECIHSYYKYGHALLNKAQEEADPLGAMPKKDAESRQNSATVEAVKNNVDGESSVASASSNVEQSASSNQQQGADDVPDKSEEEQGEESDVEEVEAEEDESDLDLAWKMLDLARVISEKHSTETMDMVEILSALAEVSLEREDIETSLDDYKKALSILERLAEPDSRHIVELNFRICLTLEVGSRAQEAIPYCQRATSVCKSRMQRLTDELKGISGPTSTSAASEPEPGVNNSSISTQSENSVPDKQAEIEALRSISGDLEKKLEDLQQLESNPRSILSDILGLAAAKARAGQQAAASAAVSSSCVAVGSSSNGDFGSPTVSTAHTAHTNGTAGVTHLGVVGRGVKRVIMTESSASKKPALDPKSDTGDDSGS